MAIEFHRDGPWELPDGWVWVSLRHLVSLRGEKAPPDRTSSFVFIGMDNVPPNSLRIETRGEFSAMKSAGNKFYPNDILYGRLRPYLNKVVVADLEGVASGEFIVMHTPDAIEPRYLQLFMHGRRFVNLATADTSGDRPRIDFDKIADIEVPLAPAAEQRRIVARIDELFTEIADGEIMLARARDDLGTWRRALLKAAVTGELTSEWREHNGSNATGADLVAISAELKVQFGVKSNRKRSKIELDNSDSENPPEIPEGWTLAALGDFARASSYGTSTKCSFDAHGVAVLRIPNIRSGRIDLRNLKRAIAPLDISDDDFLDVGDLLIVRTNGSAELIGRAAIVEEVTNDRLYFASYLIRFRIVDHMHLRQWIALYLESPVARAWIQKNIASSAGQYNISQSALMRMPIPVPSEPEMAAALKIFSEAETSRADVAIEANEAYRSSTGFRQAILKVAFEGRLCGQSARDEPAERLLARLSEQAEKAPNSQRPRRRPKRNALAAE